MSDNYRFGSGNSDILKIPQNMQFLDFFSLFLDNCNQFRVGLPQFSYSYLFLGNYQPTIGSGCLVFVCYTELYLNFLLLITILCNV